MPPITLLIIGAGDRGRTYAQYATAYPESAQIISVAEPRTHYREEMAAMHNIPAENIAESWEVLAERDKFADAVIIATPDNLHTAPAIAFAEKGYHILLEKPMAPTEAESRAIYQAVKDNSITFAVCHVLRYTRYTQMLKALLTEGAVGEIVSIQHLEPVGFWHQAHSFVRGNWRNTAQSAPMLLAKSCHDIDWISYIMDDSCELVSSFGSLTHFKASEAPPNAGQRCTDCEAEPDCPYSAKRIYFSMLARGITGWPLHILTPDPNEETLQAALESGPYGHCVYACDNDVVDHQIVNLQFAGGQTASFTMTAFTEAAQRKTHIFGTRGEIYGDGKTIQIYDFITDSKREVDTTTDNPDLMAGHGGGDYGIMHSFITALLENDPTHILSGPGETLESHLIVFTAERARENGTVERVNVE